MHVINIHQRRLPLPAEQVGALLLQLATPTDPVWPRQHWPRMCMDRPLAVGAAGGHGPIRYTVDALTPGRSVRFRFSAPHGFDGWHMLQVVPLGPSATMLEHRLEMHARGLSRMAWPLVFRPLHDALVEDALAQAQQALGLTPERRPWSLWVRMLRVLLSPAGGTQRRASEARHAR